VVSALSDITNNLVAAMLGAAAMYLAVRTKEKLRQQALDRQVRRFFGLPGPLVVVHSAILEVPKDLPTYS
jgi:hypothetical protein